MIQFSKSAEMANWKVAIQQRQQVRNVVELASGSSDTQNLRLTKMTYQLTSGDSTHCRCQFQSPLSPQAGHMPKPTCSGQWGPAHKTCKIKPHSNPAQGALFKKPSHSKEKLKYQTINANKTSTKVLYLKTWNKTPTECNESVAIQRAHRPWRHHISSQLRYHTCQVNIFELGNQKLQANFPCLEQLGAYLQLGGSKGEINSR